MAQLRDRIGRPISPGDYVSFKHSTVVDGVSFTNRGRGHVRRIVPDEKGVVLMILGPDGWRHTRPEHCRKYSRTVQVDGVKPSRRRRSTR